MPYLYLVIFIFISGLIGCSSPPPEPIAQPVEERYISRGRELVSGLAACGYCHGLQSSPLSPLGGGRIQADIYGEVSAPNLTPAKSGLKSWSADSILAALRAGASEDVEIFSPEVHRGYEWMSDEDALSVIAYIKLLDPVEHTVPRREVSSLDRNTVGFWVGQQNVIGYVPEINKRFSVAYGRYLVDHVARCQSCHNSPGGLVDDEGYLEGGKAVRSDKGEAVSPALGGSFTNGLGSWSEKDVVRYLRTGMTAQNRYVNPAFCPTNFYTNASETDLLAMARFLKSLASK
jgi:hypothetical protein